MAEFIIDNLRRKARVVDARAVRVVKSWLSAALTDFKAHIGVSILCGCALVALGWLAIWALWQLELSWMILPTVAGAMLLGPMATVGLYRISRRAQGSGGGGVAAPGQIFLVSVVMMVLLLAWIRAATILFAVFYGLRPFAGFTETLQTLFSTPSGIALFLVGSAVGGLFAALGFAISVFSFPMLVNRDIDGFSAMGLSFNATTSNFRLMLLWAMCVTALVGLGVATGLLGLIVIFPILGFATWHAYIDLFEDDGDV